MCFSATASFFASGLLAIVGVATVWQVVDRRQMFLASIPLLFAVQQAAEGVVWLSFNYDTFAWMRIIAAYFFLFFAFILWPTWGPLSVYSLETMEQFKDYSYDYSRKRLLVLRVLLFIGFLVSSYYTISLFRHDLIVQVLDCHILYKLPSTIWVQIGYLVAAIVPFLVARETMMQLFGALLGLSFLVSYFFYYYFLVSVWCFFAALLSALCFVMIYKQKDRG